MNSFRSECFCRFYVEKNLNLQLTRALHVARSSFGKIIAAVLLLLISFPSHARGVYSSDGFGLFEFLLILGALALATVSIAEDVKKKGIYKGVLENPVVSFLFFISLAVAGCYVLAKFIYGADGF